MRLTQAQRQARYRERNPEKIAAYKKSDACKQSNAKYRLTHGPHPLNAPGTDSYKKYRASEKYRVTVTNAQLKRVYGITYAQYQEMLVAQGGVCKICLGNNPRKSPRRILRPLFVDHCHTTNKVRGLLCNLCNNGLGAFKENTDAMLRAISYLKESGNF